MCFFLMSQGSFTPKIRFLGQKVCSVARDTHTDTQESEYRGHPFRVSGMFPSTYHQGSVQKTIHFAYFVTHCALSERTEPLESEI